MHETDEWQAALESNGWTDNFATGEEFEDFLVEQDARVAGTLEELGLA
jgi:putative tricarboxylic transport membrane protein